MLTHLETAVGRGVSFQMILNDFYRKCAIVYMVLVVLENRSRTELPMLQPHTPFQAAEGFSRIYGVSLARSYIEVAGKTKNVHELVTEPPVQPLEVLSEDIHVRCVMALHEEEAKPTWVHN
ncbi:Uncharacterized protein Rs2_37797 [Raphanus sativus]|nr:Uncharacterized protein Rs2_37797 [Raphanus sativus]